MDRVDHASEADRIPTPDISGYEFRAARAKRDSSDSGSVFGGSPSRLEHRSSPSAILPPPLPPSSLLASGTSPPQRATMHFERVHPSATPIVVADVPVELTPERITKAQRHARFAISALDYEDSEQAKKELRTALAILGGR
jgi:vacuolar protein sorting-associated protein VTA1